jgi:Protein of unknown function (DUF1059)
MSTRVLRCDCGFEARGEHEEGLAEEVERHAREAHGLPLSHEEALLLSRRAPGASAERAVAYPPERVSGRFAQS